MVKKPGFCLDKFEQLGLAVSIASRLRDARSSAGTANLPVCLLSQQSPLDYKNQLRIC